MSPQTVHSPGSPIPAQAAQMPAKAESPLSEASYAWPLGRLRGVQTSVPSCVDPWGQKAAVTEGLQAGLCLETRGKEGQEFTRWRRGRKNILLSRCNALVARIKLTSEIVKKKKKMLWAKYSGSQSGVPQDSGLSITWSLIRNTNSQAPPQIYRIRNSGKCSV